MHKNDYASLRRSLQEFLETRFEDVTVEIGDDIHYKGTNVVVTSTQFEGLLAEQRFHHVVRAVPKEFYEEHLRRGIVWFELTPGETGRDLMKMPRAEDIASNEAAILKKLNEVGFFSKFLADLEPEPQRASITHFSTAKRILAEAGLGEEDITQACLFMILQGAYCDAHILKDLAPKFASDAA